MIQIGDLLGSQKHSEGSRVEIYWAFKNRVKYLDWRFTVLSKTY
jgi:hypothetical protein